MNTNNMKIPEVMINKLSKLNNTTIATHFDSFDFSTLYTNIPHDLLLDCLNNLVKEAYWVRGGNIYFSRS